MAWNEPGSGNRDPWNQNNNGKGGNNQGPPDLDEVFNKLKARFSGKGGKGGGGPKLPVIAGGAGLIAGVLVALWVLLGL